MAKQKIQKVAKALKKASNTHAKQAKTLEAIKLKKGGSASDVPDNVANPSLYRKAKAKAKAKADVATGTTAIGTEKALSTQVTSDTTNYLIVRVTSDGSTDEIYGGYVTIAAV